MKIILFFICILIIGSTTCFGQDIVNPKNLRLANIAHDYATYTQILQNPKLIYDKTDCQVTNFTVGIWTRDNSFFGPYKIRGTELSALVKEKLEKLRGTQIKIYIDSIRVSCNGKNNLLGAQLHYYCK